MNDELNTVLGGQQISITKRDGSQETVLVRELTVSELTKYAMTLDYEPKIAELFCDKPAGWADSLTRESFVAVIVKGEEMNLSFFSDWMSRRLERNRRMLPGMDEKLLEIARQAAVSASAASA